MADNQGKRYSTVLGAISRWAFIFGSILGVIIVIGNAYEVTARYAFNNPTGIMDEILIYADTILIWLILGWGWRTKSHISIEIITSRLRGRLRSRLSLGTLLVSFIAAVGLAVAVWLYEVELIRTWRRPDTNLGTPWAIPHMIVCIGVTIFCLEMLLTLFNEIKSWFSKEQTVLPKQD